MTTGWPFRSRLVKTIFFVCVVIMLASAMFGLVSWFFSRSFERLSLTSLTVGFGALMIALSLLVVEVMTRKFHPETGLFMWSDVDELRDIANRPALDVATRDWARSLADRIAIVLPGRH